jgi:hypothetical protein
MLDVVHPAQFRKILQEKPGTKESLEIILNFPFTLWASISRRFDAD